MFKIISREGQLILIIFGFVKELNMRNLQEYDPHVKKPSFKWHIKTNNFQLEVECLSLVSGSC